MRVSEEVVRHVGHLARIELSEADISRLSRELSGVVGMADKLQELDTEGVEPTTHAISVTNVFREDVCKPSFDRETILENSAERDEKAFLVPQVVE